MLVHDRRTRVNAHRVVADLPQYLQPGDLLVLNDTRVRPWRLRGTRTTGGAVECLLLRVEGSAGEAFVKPSKKLHRGDTLSMEAGAVDLILREPLGGGRWLVELHAAA